MDEEATSHSCYDAAGINWHLDEPYLMVDDDLTMICFIAIGYGYVGDKYHEGMDQE